MFCRGCSSLERVGNDSIILIEASVRLRNLGRTSPSSPAASSSAASHSDKTVPTNWAKHSVHVRSGLGLPSAIQMLITLRSVGCGWVGRVVARRGSLVVRVFNLRLF